MMKFFEDAVSSEYAAIANDELKDHDNGIWLIHLPQPIQAHWLQRFYWIRWVDRLAEQDRLVRPGGSQFMAFYGAWRRLHQQHRLSSGDRRWTVLQQIEASWFRESAGDRHQSEIAAWDRYVEAALQYHQTQLTIATLEDYEVMLERVAGSCFQVLPFLTEEQRPLAGGFGLIDQFYNNLRDLEEDAGQGVCYFPEALLDQFGVTRQEILELTCFQNPGYRQLMEFWLDDYLPQLRQRHLALLSASNLHPAWHCLIAWFIHRYGRIEQVMKACRFNFVAFTHQYWPVVRLELAQWLTRGQLPASISSLDHVVSCDGSGRDIPSPATSGYWIR